MGPERDSLDNHEDEKTAHQDQVVNDLTIIQAQAQLIMRRIALKRTVDHEDVHQRMAVVVEAVQRLTDRNR